MSIDFGLDNVILPASWKWSLLEDLQSKEKRAIISGPFGSNISSKYFVNSGIPVIRGNNLSLSMVRFIDSGFVYLSKEKADELNSWAQKGDIIITAAGTIGQVGIIEENSKYSKYVISNKQLRVRFDSNRIIPLFAYYWLASPQIRNFIQQRNTGSTIPLINLSIIKSIPMPLPSKREQEKIVSILSALDDKIELNRQTNATLEAIAQAIFKEWFVNFNFPGATGERIESELGMIPEGWRVVQLGEVSDLSWGDTKTTKNSYSSEGYIAYSASGPDGYLSYYDFSRDGIVVSAIGAYSGKTWFAHGYWSCIKNTIRFWSTDDNLSNEYLYLYTSPKGFWPLRGSAQPFISQTDAREKRIIYPGNHLARYFGEVLQPLFQLIRRNDDEAFTLSQTRDSLLPKLMNGEIEV